MDSRSTPLTPTLRRGSAARRQRFGRLPAAQLAIACGPAAAPSQEKPLTPEAALQRLKDGNARFVTDKVVKKDTGPARRLELAKGQSPLAVVLTCADSRVAPELVFNRGLGELFVLRVAGNVVDDSHGMLGSAEYAVLHLKVPLIVVMGHESCGAVTAVLKGESAQGNLSRLLKSVRVGKDLPEDKTAALAAATQANTLFQAGEMILQSDVLKEFAESGRILIVPAVYSLTTGEVTWLDPVRTKPKAPKTK
jgi:carbonic anhydrase